MKLFVDEMSKAFKLHLYGMDILVSEGDENIYLIDINYFPSYKGLKFLNVQNEVKRLIEKKIKENKEELNPPHH